MIGVSLPIIYTSETASLLSELWDRGVRSVELRSVNPKTDTELVAHIAAELWGRGFQITVDIAPFDISATPAEILAPLSLLWQKMPQECLPVVLHLLRGGEETCVRALAEYAEKNAYPIRILLSNEQAGTESDAETLLALAETIGRHDVALCLDLDGVQNGHLSLCLDERMRQKHMAYVRVHIHPTEQEMDTVSLRTYLEKLCFKYFGVYNATLDFERDAECSCDETTLLTAVEQVKAAMPFCAKLYDDLRENFDSRFMHALSMYDGTEYGTRFALIQSSSFLFCSNGFRWGMDIAFRGAYRLANTPKQAATLLADLELMVISHGHSDHFEERTVRALAQNPTKWVIPDFLEEQAISYGISREKMIIAHAGETLRVGPLTIRPFPGRHFRPVTGKGIEEYGYHISVDGGPAMAFPVDTRDFALRDMPKLPPANYCFANVWLGDSCGNTADYGERPAEFARFMLHFSEQNILFAHLYECDRKEKDMWREEHAALLAKTISRMNPDTRTLIPCPGEIYELS